MSATVKERVRQRHEEQRERDAENASVEPQRVGSNSNGGRQGLPAESDKNSKDVSDGKRRHGLFTILLLHEEILCDSYSANSLNSIS